MRNEIQMAKAMCVPIPRFDVNGLLYSVNGINRLRRFVFYPFLAHTRPFPDEVHSKNGIPL